tara:strand:+ start:1958 stop:2692 length:735 start_codon:yes stop_codon:yes gene_type:complete
MATYFYGEGSTPTWSGTLTDQLKEDILIMEVGESDGLMLNSLKIMCPYFMTCPDAVIGSSSAQSYPPHERLMIQPRIGPNGNSLSTVLEKPVGNYTPFVSSGSTPYWVVNGNNGGSQGTVSERVIDPGAAHGSSTGNYAYDVNHYPPSGEGTQYANPYTYAHGSGTGWTNGNWQNTSTTYPNQGPLAVHNLPLHTDTVTVRYIDTGYLLIIKVIAASTATVTGTPSAVLKSAPIFFIAEVGPRG